MACHAACCQRASAQTPLPTPSTMGRGGHEACIPTCKSCVLVNLLILEVGWHFVLIIIHALHIKRRGTRRWRVPPEWPSRAAKLL